MRIPFTNIHISRVKRKAKTIHNEEVKELMEYAFTLKDSEGKDHDYYQFANPMNMTYMRFAKLMQIQEQVDDRMTREQRRELTNTLRMCLDRDPISITGIAKVLQIMEHTDNLVIDMDIFSSLLCCYFIDVSENEDVTDYNEEFNEKKAEIFKAQPPDSFFFAKPIVKLIPLKGISEEDLQVCLKQTAIKNQLFKEMIALGINDTLEKSESD